MLKNFSLPLFLSGIGLFFFFGFFSFLVDKNFFRQFDFNMTVRLQDNLPRRLDQLFSLFSDIGIFEVMLLVVLALVVVFFLSKKILAALAVFGLFGGFHVIELFGKRVVEQLPPPQFMLRTEHLMNFPQFHIREEFSYPSGHSGRAFFLSTILIIMILQSKLPPLIKLVLCSGLIGYDIVMIVSRVYLGEHWTTDVIGGAILGIAFGLITGSFFVTKSAGKGKSLLPKFKVEIKRVD